MGTGVTPLLLPLDYFFNKGSLREPSKLHKNILHNR